MCVCTPIYRLCVHASVCLYVFAAAVDSNQLIRGQAWPHDFHGYRTDTHHRPLTRDLTHTFTHPWGIMTLYGRVCLALEHRRCMARNSSTPDLRKCHADTVDYCIALCNGLYNTDTFGSKVELFLLPLTCLQREPECSQTINACVFACVMLSFCCHFRLMGIPSLFVFNTLTHCDSQKHGKYIKQQLHCLNSFTDKCNEWSYAQKVYIYFYPLEKNKYVQAWGDNVEVNV